MRIALRNQGNVLLLCSCLVLIVGCAHRAPMTTATLAPTSKVKAVKSPGAVLLRLKGEMGRKEQVDYLHRSYADAYENQQITKHQEESLAFTAQSETVKSEPDSGSKLGMFTQVMTIVKKEGVADLHDFAMPELGESLEITAQSNGRILKSGDYPPNSIFYVSPVSLPDGPVSVGDTWAMQASWLSMGEMVPYQLDMVSILKGFWECGDDTCADIEISGEVRIQGPLNQALAFQSTWRGRMYFAQKAGTVVWSRVDSDERLLADNVRRDVNACLESVLQEPASIRVGVTKPSCEKIAAAETETAVVAP